MSDVRYNLLTEPLLGVDLPDGTRSACSLPGVLAQLCAGVDIELAALQVHQQHAFYAFLVQLAAIALHRGERPAPGPASAPNEEQFRALLRSLCGGRDDAFCLFVADLGQPAFMQPPVPQGKLDDFKNERATPDELDVLATAKNHDVKKSKIVRPRPEHWIYALVSLQTMQGYTGKFNYGISRMNGGFGSRPYITLAPTQRMAGRFLRDVRMWLELRATLIQSYGYSESGPALLWKDAWDGATHDTFRACDPFYIEICRRVRLVLRKDQLHGLQAPTEGGRLEAKDAKGDTGDLWTPVDVAAAKAFTASDAGLRYDVVQDLLVGADYKSPACSMRDDETAGPADWVFIGRVLVRGNKTEGFRERTIPMPVEARRRLGSAEGRKYIRERATQQVARTSEVQRKVLYPALAMLLAAGEGDRRPPRDQRPGRFTKIYSDLVDAVFFESLWGSLDLHADAAQVRWDAHLRSSADTALQEAIRSVPLPASRREKAIALAEITFKRSARYLMADLHAQGAVSDDR